MASYRELDNKLAHMYTIHPSKHTFAGFERKRKKNGEIGRK